MPASLRADAPHDLFDEVALAAAGAEMDALSAGRAIEGAPGTCTACHHASIWHRARGHKACEKCPCVGLVRGAR